MDLRDKLAKYRHQLSLQGVSLPPLSASALGLQHAVLRASGRVVPYGFQYHPYDVLSSPLACLGQTTDPFFLNAIETLHATSHERQQEALRRALIIERCRGSLGSNTRAEEIGLFRFPHDSPELPDLSQHAKMTATLGEGFCRRPVDQSASKPTLTALPPSSAEQHLRSSILADQEMSSNKNLREGITAPANPHVMEAASSLLSLTDLDPEGSGWLRMFKALKDFKFRKGTTNVTKYNCSDASLVKWAQNQRRNYKEYNSGKKSPLTFEQIKALESISFEWYQRGSSWDRRFKELQEFKAKHGDCLVPMRFKENPSLGMWVNNVRIQRRLFAEGKPSQMTTEREQALEELGFVWEVKRPSNEKEWHARLDELREFRFVHGHCNVPHRYSPNQKLGWWVQTQRKQHKLLKRGKRSNLTMERINTLESEGFVWSVPLGRTKKEEQLKR